MTLVVAVLAGLAGGVGLVAAVRSLRRRPVPLPVALATLQRRGVSSVETSSSQPRRDRRGVLPLEAVREAVARTVNEGDIRVTGRSLEEHTTRKLWGLVIGFALIVGLAVVVQMAGRIVPWPSVMAVAVGAAAMGWVYPEVMLRREVAARRAEFRRHLAGYLDVVAVIVAGGGGLEEALVTAAQLGDGWVFAELRGALSRAAVTARTPWDVLTELGEEFGVPDLVELGHMALLAGEHGAQVRHSLTARADTMRLRQTTTIEADAEKRTSRMVMPIVGMALGVFMFLLFGVATSDFGDTATIPAEVEASP